MYTRLMDFLNRFNQIYTRQFGFRKAHSTTDTLINIVERIRKCLDKGEFACGVFVDLQKAFDTIDHNLLLNKLSMFGICDNELRWMESYLVNRMQSVFTGGVSSSPQPVVSGVPQGSILGPILISLYVTDLPDCLQNSEVLMYADDTVIYYSASDPSQLIRVLNEELKLLEGWSKYLFRRTNS